MENNRENRHLRIAVYLVPTAHKSMKWRLGMFLEEVGPDWIEAGFESRSAEVIWINARAEAITLRHISVRLNLIEQKNRIINIRSK